MLCTLPLSVLALALGFALKGFATRAGLEGRQDTVTDTATITETTTVTTTESASASVSSATSTSTTTLTTARSTATSPVEAGAASFSSNEPLVCVEGCWLALGYWRDCYAQNTTDACGPVCTGTNYTAIVACFECSVANGEQDLDFPLGSLELGLVNRVCGALAVSGFEASTTLTATPTTTGPFSTSGTANLTLPTWTGLTSYVDAYTSSLAAAAAAASSTNSSSSVSTSASQTSSSASSSASASASSGAARRNTVPMGGAMLLLLALLAV